MSKNSRKGWDAVVLNPTDQLATALRHLKAGDVVRFLVGEEAQELIMVTDVALCHKFAIHNLNLLWFVLKTNLMILHEEKVDLVQQVSNIYDNLITLF